MNQAIRSAYRHAEFDTLTQRDLIVKLYAGAERFLVVAQKAMRENRIEDAHVNCQKAKAIFTELLSTLSFEAGGDIARQLRDLYTFFLAHIAEANLRRQPRMLAEVVPVIAQLRSAWEAIPADLANHSALTESQGHVFSARS
jgi:flagellar protein FliS